MAVITRATTHAAQGHDGQGHQPPTGHHHQDLDQLGEDEGEAAQLGQPVAPARPEQNGVGHRAQEQHRHPEPQDDQRGFGLGRVDGAEVEERGQMGGEDDRHHHGQYAGGGEEGPRRADEIGHAVAVVGGGQPSHPLHGRRGHAHVEQADVADDGQEHDPQPVGAGAQVTQQDPGEEQAHHHGQKEVAVAGGHVADQLAGTGVGRRRVVRTRSGLRCAFAVHRQSYPVPFVASRDRRTVRSRRRSRAPSARR